MTANFIDIMGEDELAANSGQPFIVNGWPVMICRTDAGISAVINRCTHAESTFDGGRVRRGTISCPLHGARFNLADGKCIGAPYRPLKTFPVQVENGRILVDVPVEEPGHEYRPVQVG